MNIVPAVHTPIDAATAAVHLVAAMPGIDRDAGTLLLALVWVETGGGNLMNHNAGNISASDKWGGAAWRPPWFAVDASSPAKMVELHERMLHGQAPSAFRAYGSALEGFQDFARVLRSQFPTVIAAASSGDARAFVTALHDSGYSRDYSAAHVPTFQHLQNQLGVHFQGFPPGNGGGVNPGFALGAGVALAAAAAVVLTHKPKRRRRRERRS